MDETALVLTEVHSADVVELSLNRVGALNALSTGFVREIYESVARARDLDPVVLVVTSRCERAFSVGADLKERAAMSAADLIDCRADFEAAYRSLLELPFPVVCAINGFAVGGGFELALTCDVIVADKTAVVGLPEVTIGLIPGGGGSEPRRPDGSASSTGWSSQGMPGPPRSSWPRRSPPGLPERSSSPSGR